MKHLSSLFKALSEEIRLQMLAMLLWEGELCVCDFEHVLKISQSKASRHLRYLLNAGLLVDRREGVWAYYKISPLLQSEAKSILESFQSILAAKNRDDLRLKLAEWLKNKERPQKGCSHSILTDTN